MNSELLRFHLILNSEELVPPVAYRRNVVIFELVRYVNCLLGCVLSQRRDVLPVWIRRCRAFIKQHPAQADWKKYYAAVRDYIAELEREFEFTAAELDL
jgi:hypothetical protein